MTYMYQGSIQWGGRGEASPKTLQASPLCILVIVVIVLTCGLIASPKIKIPR